MSQGGYVGACEDYQAEEIIVWERDENGRTAVRHPAPFYFYVPSDTGEFISMFDEQLTKLSFETRAELKIAKTRYHHRYESDFSALDKCLMDTYYGRPIPPIHCGMFDIEVDVDEEGFATPKNPRLPVNALTLYHDWSDTFYTIAIPPPEWDGVDFVPDPTEFGYDAIKNLEFFIVENELELLSLFLELIVDVDFLSGWNSEFFDLPYLYGRILLLFGEAGVAQLCFDGAGKPKIREVERFGTPEMTIALSGRNHLDFMAMFKKFTFEGRSSFALGNICEEELDISKLEYEGTLRELYYNDFKHFCTYNLIDVLLIKKLNVKFGFVAQVNQMAHENTVSLEAILGTTKYVDTGITNFAHHHLNKIVKDKDPPLKHGKVEGAIVMTPNKGLHPWVGSVDINGLYPSTIRSLNISPEMYIGQFDTEETIDRMRKLPEVQPIIIAARKKGVSLDVFFTGMAKEADWKGIYAKDDYPHTAIIRDKYITMTGKEWNEYLRERQWAISAYGTIFDQSKGQGIVPAVLEFWATERKTLQAELKLWKKKARELRELNVK